MANWKKLIVSASNAHLSSVTASNGSIVSGSLVVTGSSQLIGDQIVTGSIYITGSVASIAYPQYIDLNTNPTQSLNSSVIGRLSWDNARRDLLIGVNGAENLEIGLGQSEWAYVYNAEATSLTKGEIVYVSGSQGNTISVKRAGNQGDPSSAGTLGMVGETIAAGAEGLVLVNGLMTKLNTVGLTAGASLYLSSTPGTYTETKPTPPSHSVRIGYVVRVHATVGEIYIKVDNGYELGELHDLVDTTTTSSYGDLLIKSGSVWKNSKQLTGSYGVTGSIDINGTLQLNNAQIYSNKAGTVIPGAFAGLPLRYTVSFTTGFSNNNYAVTVTGADLRSWTVENKALGGFVINSNSNVPLAGDVYWIAVPHYS